MVGIRIKHIQRSSIQKKVSNDKKIIKIKFYYNVNEVQEMVHKISRNIGSGVHI